MIARHGISSMPSILPVRISVPPIYITGDTTRHDRVSDRSFWHIPASPGWNPKISAQHPPVTPSCSIASNVWWTLDTLRCVTGVHSLGFALRASIVSLPDPNICLAIRVAASIIIEPSHQKANSIRWCSALAGRFFIQWKSALGIVVPWAPFFLSVSGFLLDFDESFDWSLITKPGPAYRVFQFRNHDPKDRECKSDHENQEKARVFILVSDEQRQQD